MLGHRRGAAPAREYRLEIGPQRWRAVFLDAGSRELGTVKPSEDAVALYECSVTEAGQFVALLPIRELVEATGRYPELAVGDGEGRWRFAGQLLSELRQVMKFDRQQRRWRR